MKIAAVALNALFLLGAHAATAFPTDEPSQSPASQAEVNHERAALSDAMKQAQQPGGDKFILAASLKSILADQGFAALSEKEQHAAYLFYGTTLFDIKDYANAQPIVKTSSVMPDAGVQDWDLRFRIAYRLEDYGNALAALTKLAQNWPQQIAAYNDHAIITVFNESQNLPANADALEIFLTALFDMKWRAKDPFSNYDGVWMTLIQIRIAHGDLSGAEAVAATLTDPAEMITLHADKQFDALVQSAPEHFDVAKAYTTELADLKAKSTAAPDKLKGINAVAEVLSELGRSQEQFDLESDAIARANANPKQFSDYADEISFCHDQLSSALFKLGRTDEGFAAMKEGASMQEHGGMNVSQAIDLAEQYDDYDRPKEALVAVGALDFTSATPYGRMALEDARGRAYYELGDKANLSNVLAYLKAHAQDAIQIYLNVAIYTGDLDDAATEIITELNDPSRRDDILYYLQDYPIPPNESDRQKAVRANWIAVRERADVSAVIEKVGHIESYALASPTY